MTPHRRQVRAGKVLLLPAVALIFASCESAPPPVTAEPTSVVRVPTSTATPVSRPPAQPFEVTEALRERVQVVTLAESAENELFDIVGLQYPEGPVLYVTHASYPYREMSDAERNAAYDEPTYHRCRDEFRPCIGGVDGCDIDGYNACIRTAFRSDYMYASTHLILSCGILHLSRYALSDDALRLVDRVALETMACHLEETPLVPVAADIDGDEGPELTFAYAFAGIEADDRGSYAETLTIVDAEDLHVQARLLLRGELGENLVPRSIRGETARLGHVATTDRNGDGHPDLVRTDLVGTGRYCPEPGWTNDLELLVAKREADACTTTTSETVLPYDPATDSWISVENAP